MPKRDHQHMSWAERHAVITRIGKLILRHHLIRMTKLTGLLHAHTFLHALLATASRRDDPCRLRPLHPMANLMQLFQGSYLNDSDTRVRNAATLPSSTFMSILVTSATRRSRSDSLAVS